MRTWLHSRAMSSLTRQAQPKTSHKPVVPLNSSLLCEDGTLYGPLTSRCAIIGLVGWLFLELLLASCVAQAAPASKTTDWNAAAHILHATFDVELWPKAHRIEVDARLTIKATPFPRKLRVFLPQLIQLARVERRTTKGWKPVLFRRELETAVLQFPKALAAQTQLRLRYSIEFHSEKNYLFRAIFCRIDDRETYFLYGWYPSLHPFADPLSGRLLRSDRFPYQLNIALPTTHTAVAAGQVIRVKQLSGGRQRFTYTPSSLKEAAIFFSAGPFRRTLVTPAPNTRVEFFLRDDDGTQNLQKLAQMVVKAAQFYGRVWGMPKLHKRLKGQMSWKMISFGGSGARGYPFTLLLDRRQDYFAGSLAEHVDSLFTRRQVLLHEMAHTWWGNAVTGVGDGSVWLNEGLANYASIRALGALYGERVEKAAIRRHVRHFLNSKGSGGLLDPGGLAQMLQRTAYTKGALVFFELERHIGRAAVDRGLRLFFRQNYGQFAVIKDLQAAFQKAAGKSLESFFQRWIAGRGLPFVQLKQWSSKRTRSGCALSVTLLNSGLIPTMTHIRAFSAKGRTKDLWVHTGNSTAHSHPFRAALRLPWCPKRIQVDPEGLMLHGLRIHAAFAKANGFRQAGELAQAAPLFAYILRNAPQHGQALYSFGLLLQAQKKYDDAATHFLRASKLKASEFTPDWVPLWSKFRYAALLLQRGKTKRAQAIFQQLLKQPHDPHDLKERIRNTIKTP